MNINFNFRGVVKVVVGTIATLIVAAIVLFIVGNVSTGLGDFLNEYSNEETFFGKIFYNFVKVLYNLGSLATLLAIVITIVLIAYFIIQKSKDSSNNF